MYKALQHASETVRDEVSALASQLVQTKSISGEEKPLADLLLATMQALGYDEAFRDAAGNVVGVIKGTGGGPNIMYNSHMDHPDAGDPANWEYPPYGGVIAEGYLHGRAASDVKAGMAAQLLAGALLGRLGVKLKGDLIFTGVVQEEPAEMFGIRHLMDVTCKQRGITFDLMVSSEATGLDLYLGHRGRVELEVTTNGRTSHGSAPWLGINAVYKMLPVLEAVQTLADDLPQDALLGKASVALTNITCSPGQLSIMPDVCTAWLDRRLIPSETKEKAVAEIQAILDRLAGADPEFKGSVKVRTVRETSYTGLAEDCEKVMYAWSLPTDHPLVEKVVLALRAVGQNPGFGRWDFGTDASYVTGRLGIPTIGYSPMEERYAHTPIDRCSIDLLVKAVAGNAAIAYAIAG